jgi:hypothetical protein
MYSYPPYDDVHCDIFEDSQGRAVLAVVHLICDAIILAFSPRTIVLVGFCASKPLLFLSVVSFACNGTPFRRVPNPFSVTVCSTIRPTSKVSVYIVFVPCLLRQPSLLGNWSKGSAANVSGYIAITANGCYCLILHIIAPLTHRLL